VIYLHAIDSGRIIIENIDILAALCRLPILHWLRFASLQDLEKSPRRTRFLMTVRACEFLRVHEVIKLLVCPRELEVGTAFSAHTYEKLFTLGPPH
jgi:hypothetical protein